MDPAWSRYAARLKNSDAVASAIRSDAAILGRVVRALADAESLNDVEDEQIRLLLDEAAEEVRAAEVQVPNKRFNLTR